MGCPPAFLNNRAQLFQLAFRPQQRAQLCRGIVSIVPVISASSPTRFFVSFLAFLSCTGRQSARSHQHVSRAPTLEFLSSSITRRSYGENPATSRITDRTNLVFVDVMPLRWLGRTAFGIAVVGCPRLEP